jgi:dihydroceramidase
MAALLAYLPRIPYPPSRPGYWDPVTSTLNWCEEDYYATIYSAEIVNSLTNLAFLYLAARGLRSCIKHGHDTIFTVSFLGYLAVGLGSFLFHSTLKYPMQLVDELSMIYTTCIMFHASFARGRSPTYSAALAGSLVLLAATITAVYHYLQDPVFHQNAYAILTAVVLIRSMWVMETHLRPTRRVGRLSRESGEDVKEKKRVGARDAATLALMWRLIAVGLSVFLGGFAIWSLDNKHCSTLRRWRRDVGLPWGILLEGHGWWCVPSHSPSPSSNFPS